MHTSDHMWQAKLASFETALQWFPNLARQRCTMVAAAVLTTRGMQRCLAGKQQLGDANPVRKALIS